MCAQGSTENRRSTGLGIQGKLCVHTQLCHGRCYPIWDPGDPHGPFWLLKPLMPTVKGTHTEGEGVYLKMSLARLQGLSQGKLSQPTREFRPRVRASLGVSNCSGEPVKGQVPVHSGVRKGSPPDGHLFLISVQFLKCHTGSLLKDLDKEKSPVNRTPECARCCARCFPCACLSLTATFGGE